MLFPVIFMLASILNLVNGWVKIRQGGRDKKKQGAGRGADFFRKLPSGAFCDQRPEHLEIENEDGNIDDIKEAEGFVSGQNLCSRLNVSRTAVWKVIRQLQEEGYQIEAVRNKGYRLVQAADVMTEAEIGSRLKAGWIGKKLVYFYETDSTNLQARKLAQAGCPDGTLVVSRLSDGRKRTEREKLVFSPWRAASI